MLSEAQALCFCRPESNNKTRNRCKINGTVNNKITFPQRLSNVLASVILAIERKGRDKAREETNRGKRQSEGRDQSREETKRGNGSIGRN